MFNYNVGRTMKTKLVAIYFTLFFTLFGSNRALNEPIKLADNVELSFTGEYMSRYIYRGSDQNRSRSTASLSANISLPKGLYAGTWIAEADYAASSQEVDIYFGINQNYKDFNFDISYLEARYPGKKSANIAEYNFKIKYQPKDKPYNFGYYYALEDTSEALGSNFKEYSVGYNFDSFSLVASYGDWDAINKIKTITWSKNFNYFDLKISHIDTDNVGATADQKFNTIIISKTF